MTFGIRLVLRAGASVFGVSALLLILAPELFLDLLALDGKSSALQWSMRMIGITLVDLAGNMWMNSHQKDDAHVRRVGMVMAVAANGLGVLTLLIPAELTWFSYLYAAVGFAFGLTYVVCLSTNKI